MLSVDQLVPLPVVGEEDEVVVGELQTRAGRLHVIAPGHRLIVAVSRTPAVPRTKRRSPSNQTDAERWDAEISIPDRFARGRICRNGECMNRRPVVAVWVGARVAVGAIGGAAEA